MNTLAYFRFTMLLFIIIRLYVPRFLSIFLTYKFSFINCVNHKINNKLSYIIFFWKHNLYSVMITRDKRKECFGRIQDEIDDANENLIILRGLNVRVEK